MFYKLGGLLILVNNVSCIYEMEMVLASVNPLKQLSDWKEAIYQEKYSIY